MVANIWIAVADGDLNTVKQLIDSGVYEANSKDENGYTPVHAACAYGNLEILDFLVSKGGDVNLTDSDGDSSLFHCEDVQTVDVLIQKYGADWSVKNAEGLNLREFFLEDNEYPEIIGYFDKLLNHDSSTSLNYETEGNGPDIRYTYTDNLPVDEERQQRIRDIVNGENPEENLQKFLTESIQQQMNAQQQAEFSDSPNSKKQRH